MEPSQGPVHPLSGDGESRASPLEPLLAKRDRLLEQHRLDAGLDAGLDPQQKSERLRKVFVDEIWPSLSKDYDDMVDRLIKLLRHVLRAVKIDAQVTGRAKELSSVAKTLERREGDLWKNKQSRFESLEQIFHEMHDLAGLRIVVTYHDDFEKAKQVVGETFAERKKPQVWGPDREVYRHWKTPWFGAYQASNHRVALPENKSDDLLRYGDITFEVQVVPMADSMYNILAHDLLYKDAAESRTLQDEISLDLSRGLAKCFALSVLSMKSKLQGSDTTAKRQESEKFGIPAQASKEVESALDGFLKDAEKDIDALGSDKTYAIIGNILQHLQPQIGPHSDEDKQCLRALGRTDPRLDKQRIEDSKGGLLKDAYRWILDDPQFEQWRHRQQSGLLWIRGDPGKGKTMLLCGIIDELNKGVAEGTSPAYFFFQATDDRIDNATSVLLGLIYQLVSLRPSCISLVRKKYDSPSEKPFQDTNAWWAAKEMMAEILQDKSFGSVYLIIDALDECTKDLDLLLDLIVESSSTHDHVKWLVSSRNETVVHDGLEKLGQLKKAVHPTRISLELNAVSVSTAVDAFIQYRVEQLARAKGYDTDLQTIVHQHLSEYAEGTFLWVALVCQQLKKVQRRHTKAALHKFPSGLDSIYGQMMERIKSLEYGDAERCKELLEIVLTVYRPVTLAELSSLVRSSEGLDEVKELVDGCGSFLTVREDVVYLVHQSAKDFLRNPSNFTFDVAERHEAIYSRSRDVMSSILERDMYRLGTPGVCIHDWTPNWTPTHPNPLDGASYSCVYWVDHICASEAVDNLQDDGLVHSFLRQKVLYWFEALSLLGKIPHGTKSLGTLDELLKSQKALPLQLHGLVHDTWRFFLEHELMAREFPLQIYISGLLFSPTNSITRTLFEHDIPSWVSLKPKVANWSPCLQTIGRHRCPLASIAFTGNEVLMESVSYGGSIKIQDVSTGETQQTLQDSASGVDWSTTFSPDGQLISSWDRFERNIKIWDMASGNIKQILPGNEKVAPSLAFSHDGRLIAVSSDDYIINISNVATANIEQVLHSPDNIRSMAFSPDKLLLASGSKYKTNIQLWNLTTGKIEHTLRGHTGVVISVAFSRDGRFLASGSDDLTILLWDMATRKNTQILRGHLRSVRSITFSPNGRLMASYSWDDNVKIWDILMKQPEQAFQDHQGEILDICISPDGRLVASTSLDKTVKIWNAATDEQIQTFNFEMPVVFFEFDATSSYLLTTTGRFAINTQAKSNILPTALSKQNTSRHHWDISFYRDWILYGSEKRLWLPQEYRPFTWAVMGSSVAIGCRSGRVLLLRFTE